MKNIITLFLVTSFLFTSTTTPSTTSVVCVAGAIIKSRWSEKEKKYPRKDCPVCKGKGWYMSGDGISKVDCGYCEPTNEFLPTEPPACKDGKCDTRVLKK